MANQFFVCLFSQCCSLNKTVKKIFVIIIIAMNRYIYIYS